MRLPTVLICLMMVSALGCGTPGAPLPPSLGIPKPVGDLHAVRKGDTVTLTWSTPTDTTDGALIRKPGRMVLSRITPPRAEIAAGMSTIQIADLPLTPALADQQPSVPIAHDSLSDVLQTPRDFVLYSVEAQSRMGKSAGASNQVAVPLVPTPPAPVRLEAVAVPLGVSLSWEQAGPPENRSHLTTQYAYRIMRREQGAQTPVMVKQIDVKQINLGNEAITFVDTGIEWQKHYDYWITPITLWQSAGTKGVVEGDDSPVVAVFADDKFPPEAPVGLQAVFSGLANQPFIDLTWTPNTEPDLAGYNIYRHSGDEPAVKINSELWKTPSFRDTQVKPGTKYFYAVSAVDLRGNESGRSEETSETAPPN